MFEAFLLWTLWGALFAIRRLQREAQTDVLTGCWNRLRWLEVTGRLRRRRRRFGFVVLDVANLKAANVVLGMQGADELLVVVSGLVREEADSVYRIGGDEFVVLLPGATLGDARAVRDRIEMAVGLRYLGPSAPVFISGGVGVWSPGCDFVRRFRAADRGVTERKHARKIELGVPTERAATLAKL